VKWGEVGTTERSEACSSRHASADVALASVTSPQFPAGERLKA